MWLGTIQFVLMLRLCSWANCQACSPAFTLPNILKDQVTLNYGNGQQAFSSYFYFAALLTGTPTIAYTISSIDIQNTRAGVNFYLDIEAAPSVIDFYFDAPSMVWTEVKVSFWVTSRSDLITLTNTIVDIGQTTKTQPLNTANFATAGIDASSVQVNFIVGLWAASVGTMDINVLSGALSQAGGSVVVSNGSPGLITNITILTVLYSPTRSQFVASVGSATFQNLNSETLNIFDNTMPIFYTLTGLTSFALTPNNFQIDLTLSNNYLLTTSSSNGFTQATISYLTIGANPAQVCSPCNNFITSDSCVDQCPANSYQHTFSNGGKTCLFCYSELGQRLNDFGDGCSCLPGYQLLTGGQCQEIDQVPTVCSGNNVVQNSTQCICAPGTFNISGSCGVCTDGQTFANGECTSVNCPVNSAYDDISQQCKCQTGFVNISGICSTCQLDQFYDSTSQTCKCTGQNEVVNQVGQCQCAPGYNLIAGFCLQCPEGTVFINGQCSTQSTQCSQNQVLSNGVCVCDGLSIPVGDLCIRCASGTFANSATRQCQSCIANCNVCINGVTCQQCANGFVFDFASLTCLGNQPLDPATPSLVAVRSGFPAYTSEAVVTDFIINTTIAIKSRQELRQMITVSFPEASYAPIRTMHAQHQSQLDNFRIVFYYAGLIPMVPFTATFSFQDTSLNQTISVAYNPASAAITYSLP